MKSYQISAKSLENMALNFPQILPKNRSFAFMITTTHNNKKVFSLVLRNSHENSPVSQDVLSGK